MSFIEKYFVEPMINPMIQGYNMVNTIVFVIILILFCIGIYYFLKNRVKFDYDFLFAMLPYIFFGVGLRLIMHQIEASSLEITGIFKTANPLELGFWFFTPGVWLFTFLVVVGGLLFSEVWKKIKLKRLFWFGMVFSTPIIIFNLLNYTNWLVFVSIVVVTILVTFGSMFLVKKFSKYDIMEDKTNFFIVFGQAVDGIGSGIAVGYLGFVEQHAFSDMLIQTHPALFAVVKIVLGLLLCWSIDEYMKETKNKKMLSFIKLAIAIISLAVGIASVMKTGFI